MTTGSDGDDAVFRFTDGPRTLADLGLVRHVPDRATPNGPKTVSEVLSAAVAQWPEEEALVGRHARYTYRELAKAVDAATRALRALGVAAGDRVAASTGNHTDIVIAFFAVQAIGALWVGVNRSLAAPEKRFILEDCGASVFLGERAVVERVEEDRATLPELRVVIDMEPGDALSGWARLMAAHSGASFTETTIDPYAPAAITYTSGTTGFPKGVVHSQHNMVLVGAVAQERNRARAEAVSRAGVALPITILNLMILGPVAAFQAGQTVILMDRVDTLGLAEWIETERIEAFSAVPTMIYDLMTHPDITPEAIASFRYPGVGGAALPEAFRELYRAKFGRELTGSYGLTEAPTVVTLADPAAPIVPGASGVASSHVCVSIQDAERRPLPIGESGEICVGPATDGPFRGVYTPMLGYWRRPDATASALQGGWLHTGDMGRLDENGNLFVEGRRNDVILRGGANVYPAEIERILNEQDGVAEAAVVGRPDLRLGEKVVAVIQLSAGAPPDDATRDRLTAVCQRQLARYKVPEEWIFVSTMPRNAMNKVVKARLKADIFGS